MKDFFKAVPKKKISEDIVRQIKDLIRRKKLAPGSQLPSERDLVQALRVGRPAVREALRSLEMIGLIEVLQGKGSFVKELDFNSYLEDLKERVNFTLLSDSVSLAEFYGGRKLFEPAIARLLAATRTAEDLRLLEKIVQDARHTMDQSGKFIKFSAILHQEMAKMTRNKVVQFSMDFLLTMSPQARLQRFSAKSFREMVLHDHQRIVQCIRDGDGEAASREMESHLDHLITTRARIR